MRGGGEGLRGGGGARDGGGLRGGGPLPRPAMFVVGAQVDGASREDGPRSIFLFSKRGSSWFFRRGVMS